MKFNKINIYPLNTEKFYICCFLVFYVVSSQILLPYMGKREIFPIFKWSLFSGCDPNATVSEIEMSYFNGGDKTIITNKQFPQTLQNSFISMMIKIDDTNNLAEKEEFQNKFLNQISDSLKIKRFSYKMFKSKVNITEYVKQDSLKRGILFREGIFNSQDKSNAPIL